MKTILALLTLTSILVAWNGDQNLVRGQQSVPPGTLPKTAAKQVTAAQFSPDGKRVLVTSQDGTVRLWNLQTGRALSPGTNITAQVWDVTTGKPLPPRYSPDTPDNMPMVGPDNLKVLQDQIDALEKRVRELEKKLSASGH